LSAIVFLVATQTVEKKRVPAPTGIDARIETLSDK